MDGESSLDDGCASGAADSSTNDQREWDRFIRRTATNLARRTRDRAIEADDIAQAARVRLFRLKPAPGERTRNWLGKVLFNEMRREAGWDARHMPLTKDACEVVDASAPTETDTATRLSVQRWVDGLPAALKKVYQLLYVEGASQRAAAETLGCSQSRVNQLHRELIERGRLELMPLAA